LFNNGLNYNGLIGAFQSADRRYLEYVDGSIMNDGSFSDVGSHFFGDVYGTGPIKNVFTNVNLHFWNRFNKKVFTNLNSHFNNNKTKLKFNICL